MFQAARGSDNIETGRKFRNVVHEGERERSSKPPKGLGGRTFRDGEVIGRHPAAIRTSLPLRVGVGDMDETFFAFG